MLSFLGLIIVIMLAFFPPTVTGDASWRKVVIGSIFNIFCILGILAIFAPNRCGRILNHKMEKRISDSKRLDIFSDSPVRKGHHPTCNNYSSHIFQMKNETYCAACIGLLFGGMIALVGSIVYFYFDWQFAGHSEIVVLMGGLLVSFGLFQFKFSSLIRLFLNSLFAFGCMLILIGIDVLIQNLFFDFLVFSLIVFWLLTRILLSQWDHEIICSGCDTENCEIRTIKK